MAITIWGRATSSNVQVSMWAAAELGLTVERIDAGGTFGRTDTPEYRAMNPMGQVPTLCDGDLTLFESAAILRYLAARCGDATFWPTDPAARARLDVWAEWTKTTFLQALIYKVFWQLVRMRPEARDEAALAEGVTALMRLAPMADAALGERPYLGGEGLSFADVMLGHGLYRYYTLPFERAETPALDAYYARLSARPAYRTHVQVSYEGLRPS